MDFSRIFIYLQCLEASKHMKIMSKFASIICAILLLLTSYEAFSHDTTAVKTRPKVGLVLSGGGV